MTYGAFLAVFLVAPLALTGAAFALFRGRRLVPHFWPALGVLLLVVYAATTPWDNVAVARGLWGFDPARIWGVKLIHLPLEEYLFFGLQTLLTGLWVGRRLQQLPSREEVRAPALAAFAPLLLLGAPITAGESGADRYAYLVHLLAWGLPVLAAQLVALALHHRAETGRVLRAVLPPALLCTLWLVSADHLAISAGVWRFGEGKHLGVYLASVPLEEVLFFLITNLLVAVGLALFVALFGRRAARRAAG